MKRSLIAVSLAFVAGTVLAANFGEYQGKTDDSEMNSLQLGEAGLWQFKSNESDHGIQLGDAYRFNAGEQDEAVSIADAYRFNAGEQDEHMPKVG